MAKVSKDMLIGQIFRNDPIIAPIHMRGWNALLGCPSSRDG